MNGLILSFLLLAGCTAEGQDALVPKMLWTA